MATQWVKSPVDDAGDQFPRFACEECVRSFGGKFRWFLGVCAKHVYIIPRYSYSFHSWNSILLTCMQERRDTYVYRQYHRAQFGSHGRHKTFVAFLTTICCDLLP